LPRGQGRSALLQTRCMQMLGDGCLWRLGHLCQEGSVKVPRQFLFARGADVLVPPLESRGCVGRPASSYRPFAAQSVKSHLPGQPGSPGPHPPPHSQHPCTSQNQCTCNGNAYCFSIHVRCRRSSMLDQAEQGLQSARPEVMNVEAGQC
jgi:hypothetical protein